MFLSLIDLSIFLCLNVIGIFLLFSSFLFLASIFNKKIEKKIFSELGLNYKKINRMTFFAIILLFLISYIILRKDLVFFFENRIVLILVILGFVNFIYAGWIKKY